MRNTLIVARRELGGYFATPVAVVFIVIFLALQGVLTFNLGNFFDRNQADLAPFFNFIPWVFLLLVPAITMRLWAEERRLGTIELLLTLPITQWQAVLGKFLAAWAFCAIAPAASHAAAPPAGQQTRRTAGPWLCPLAPRHRCNGNPIRQRRRKRKTKC